MWLMAKNETQDAGNDGMLKEFMVQNKKGGNEMFIHMDESTI